MFNLVSHQVASSGSLLTICMYLAVHTPPEQVDGPVETLQEFSQKSIILSVFVSFLFCCVCLFKQVELDSLLVSNWRWSCGNL